MNRTLAVFGILGAIVLTFVAGMSLGGYLGWEAHADTRASKSCDCRPCPCQRGDGRRQTGQPTGDVAPEEKGGDL